MTIKTICYVLFLPLLTLAIGCGKKGDSTNGNVDPRDQYVGTYNVTLTEGPPKMRTLKTSIKFSKSSTTGSYLVLTDYAGDNIVELSSSHINLYKHSVNQDAFGDNKDIFSRYGSGDFNGSTVKMTTYTGGNSDGGADVKCDYVGTKQ
ncbi:hypothetical protein GJR95_11855 [Spirosoma endbachense]|uniref:Lipocalin-like domain-containing protein n=2 Tax=Spirosoma endbachense TaxID=2666025 RepID=A0A6P1VWA8_9BACT|nr:hypothetical protein GJR95_11855 [Spirosoma endbachense]